MENQRVLSLDRELKRAAGFHDGEFQIPFPGSVCRGFHGFVFDGDGHGFACIGGSPDGHGHAPLQNGSVAEESGEVDISPGRGCAREGEREGGG